MTDEPGIAVSSDYQLTVDHARLIADARIVVFADAMMHGDTPYQLSHVTASIAHDVTSHSLTPQAVLALCQTLYGEQPQAFVLGIKGHDFGEVKEGLSPLAQSNLNLATAFLRDWFAQHTIGGRGHA
jgi:hydrogenase maturation protease